MDGGGGEAETYEHPYTVEVYVARDGSEACLSRTPPKAFCAQNGVAREARPSADLKYMRVR
jgi:hypothetical protein